MNLSQLLKKAAGIMETTQMNVNTKTAKMYTLGYANEAYFTLSCLVNFTNLLCLFRGMKILYIMCKY